jgi:DNA primase
MTNESFEQFKEDVRTNNPIEEVVRETVNLNHTHMGCCPFHDDTDPSFTVSASRGFWYCFGCSDGGDVFKFVMLRDECTFLEAVNQLAVRADLKPFQFTEEDHVKWERNSRINDIRHDAARFYSENLTRSPEAQRYLTDRKIPDNLINSEMIGYASGGLAEYLIDEKEHDPELCVESGVIRKYSGEYLDIWDNHIILPNIRNGRIIHMTGRTLSEVCTDNPKYKHISGSIDLWGVDSTRNHNEVTVCEGIYDALSLMVWGIPAVALIGVALKKNLQPFFSRFNRVFICLDSDETGRRRALEIAEDIGSKCRVITLPDGQDINEFAMDHDRSDFEVLQSQARHSVSLQIEQIPVNTPRIDLRDALQSILDQLAGLDDITSEALLTETIKPRFSLTDNEVRVYRKEIRKLRKNSESDDDAETELDPIWEDRQEFSPALDFIDGVTYITVSIPCEGSEKRHCAPFVITNEREFFQLTDDNLSERKLCCGSAVKYEGSVNRWSLDPVMEYSVRSFLNNPEPSVDINDLYSRILGMYQRFVDYSDPRYHHFLSLWSLGTYIHRLFETYPYVYLSGTKRSGKTRTLEIASEICFNAKLAASVSAPTIFRNIEISRSTLLIDESERYKDRNSHDDTDLMGILNSGYKRSGCVERCVGDDHTPMSFSTYCPKMFANIESLNDVLADRSAILRTFRTNQILPSFNQTRLQPEFQAIRNRLYVLAMTWTDEILSLIDAFEPIEGIRDREEELWMPVIVLARLIDQNRPECSENNVANENLEQLMISLAIDIRESKDADEVEESYEMRILSKLLEIIDDGYPNSMPNFKRSGHLYRADILIEELKSSGLSQNMTQNSLTKRLQALNIIRDRKTDKPQRRINGKKYSFYFLPPDRLEEARMRFLPSDDDCDSPDDEMDGEFVSDKLPNLQEVLQETA